MNDGSPAENSEPPDEGRFLSDEEEQLYGWASDAYRGVVGSLQDFLRGMVTLSAALLAGSAAFLNSVREAQAMPAAIKSAWLLSFLAALGVSLFGSLPVWLHVDMQDIEDIRRKRRGVEDRKFWCAWVSAAALAVGFIALLAGLAF